MKKILTTVILCSLLLTSCGNKTVDYTNYETFLSNFTSYVHNNISNANITVEEDDYSHIIHVGFEFYTFDFNIVLDKDDNVVLVGTTCVVHESSDNTIFSQLCYVIYSSLNFPALEQDKFYNKYKFNKTKKVNVVKRFNDFTIYNYRVTYNTDFVDVQGFFIFDNRL